MTKKREGEMAGPCFSRLEAFSKTIFTGRRGLEEQEQGEHVYEELGKG